MRWAVAVGLLAAAGVTMALAAEGGQPLTVYAASSLRAVTAQIDSHARHSFAASGTLRLQIERGAPADVFASASPREAQALYRAGRCTRPRTFATNRLVLLVPAGNAGDVRSVRDLLAGGRRLALGGAGVPVGEYTRELLASMRMERVVRVNRVSSELNAAGIVAKVAARSADAGFAYATDTGAARGRVDAVELPGGAQPLIRYQACAVLRDGADIARAVKWIDALGTRRSMAVLASHGFGAP